jgi:hypothetical protein
MTEKKPDPDRVRRTAAGLYFVGLGLIGSAIAIALMGYSQMADSVSGLQRTKLPGRAEVTLAAGLTTVYVEHRSVVNGVPVEVPTAAATCTMTDAQGKPMALAPTKGNVTHSFGGHAGHRIYDVSIAAPGVYYLDCTGAGVLAVGGGLGAWLVVAIVGGLVPGVAGIVLCVIVFLKRRRQLTGRGVSGSAARA